MENNPAFNDAYWASQPIEIQKLHAAAVASPGVDQTKEYARLAASGMSVDVPIMIDGFDPYKIMVTRQSYGFAWVPSALNPPMQVVPGYGVPGSVVYDPVNPPPGAIKVSTDIADYLPVLPPAPNHPSVPTRIVGLQSFGNIYLPIPGDNSPGGTVYNDERGKFIKCIVSHGGGLQSVYWELQPS